MAKANTKPAAEQATEAPEADKTDDQAVADAGGAPSSTDPAPPAPDPEVADVVRCSVRVLAAVTIADVRYTPDAVIHGLPVALAEAYAGSLDRHDDAVTYALSVGAPVHEFED